MLANNVVFINTIRRFMSWRSKPAIRGHWVPGTVYRSCQKGWHDR